MKKRLIHVVPLVFLFFAAHIAVAQQSFDKSAFYAAIAGNDINKIDDQIKLVEVSSVPEKNAYSGALLMRKAGLAKGASNKLSLFKAGHKKLEASIGKNNDNAEFRFLRLIIQEHAPGILGYKNDMQKDVELIKKSFKELASVVQQAISDYSKKSRILNPSDF